MAKTTTMNIPSNFVSSSGISLAGVRVFHRDGGWYTGQRVGLMPSGGLLPSIIWPELYALASSQGMKIERKVLSSEKVKKASDVSEATAPKEKKVKAPKVLGKKARTPLYNPFAVLV